MKYAVSFAVSVASVLCCFGCTPAYELRNNTDVNRMPITGMKTEVTNQYAAIV